MVRCAKPWRRVPDDVSAASSPTLLFGQLLRKCSYYEPTTLQKQPLLYADRKFTCYCAAARPGVHLPVPPSVRPADDPRGPHKRAGLGAATGATLAVRGTRGGYGRIRPTSSFTPFDSQIVHLRCALYTLMGALSDARAGLL